MQILLFKKTKDSDLSEGQKVAYKNKEGEYSLSNIRQTWIDADGITRLYSLISVPGSYMADELKLIEEDPKICNSFDELKAEVSNKGVFVQVSEELYYYALECVPPIYLKNGTWQMGEEVFDNLFYTFGKKEDKYYGCLCDKKFSINNF